MVREIKSVHTHPPFNIYTDTVLISMSRIVSGLLASVFPTKMFYTILTERLNYLITLIISGEHHR